MSIKLSDNAWYTGGNLISTNTSTSAPTQPFSDLPKKTFEPLSTGFSGASDFNLSTASSVPSWILGSFTHSTSGPGASTQLSQPTSPLPSLDSQTPPAPPARVVKSLQEVFNRDVKLGPGTSGPGVAELQKFMGLPETGHFDEATHRAVDAFKKNKYGDNAPVVVGRATLNDLLQAQSKKDPNVNSLQDVLDRKGKLQLGSSGPAVAELQKFMGLPETGHFDEATYNAVDAFKKNKYGDNVPVVVGRDTLKDIMQSKAQAPGAPSTTPQKAAGLRDLGNGTSVNFNHPWLNTTSTMGLMEGGQSTCVGTVMLNLDRHPEITTFQGGTTADPNNVRGMMALMHNGGGWRSLNLPGATEVTVTSHPEYGNAKAYALSAEEYMNHVKQGNIPPGALVFTTRHGSTPENAWENDETYGNDVAIYRPDRGGLFNFAQFGDLVYDNTTSVVIMVPKEAIQGQ